MPNLKAIFEKYPEYRTMCTAPDGHIYSFPWIEQLGEGKEAIQAIGNIPYINKKWLDFLGLKVPETTEELEKVLIAFRDHAEELKSEFDIEGDVIPMSFIINNGDQDPAILINGFGEGYGCLLYTSIFERGFTGYNGREHQKSTGIGLYLCKTIIQKLGHSIRAESRVGVGTKIYISLEREDVKFE